MKRIANFPIDHLLGTPFTDIVEAIKRKSSNEIMQAEQLVANYEKDVKEPLCHSYENFKTRQAEIFDVSYKEAEKILRAESRLSAHYEEYWKTSTEFEKSLKSYREARDDQADPTDYKLSGLFSRLNRQMWGNEERGKSCDSLSR